jgi:hypothetical protein
LRDLTARRREKEYRSINIYLRVFLTTEMPSIMSYLTDILYKKERESKPAFRPHLWCQVLKKEFKEKKKRLTDGPPPPPSQLRHHRRHRHRPSPRPRLYFFL